MRYAVARFKTKNRDDAYRIYVTDGLMCLSESMCAFVGGGRKLTSRFFDLLNPAPERPKDNRTQEEIVGQIWKSIGVIK